jgi:hypothetical protein
MGRVGGTAVICAGVAYIFSVELFRGFYLQIVLPEEIYIISEGSIPLKSELFLLFVLGAPPPPPPPGPAQNISKYIKYWHHVKLLADI